MIALPGGYKLQPASIIGVVFGGYAPNVLDWLAIEDVEPALEPEPELEDVAPVRTELVPQDEPAEEADDGTALMLGIGAAFLGLLALAGVGVAVSR